MTVEPHVQVLIQEVIGAQGTSITKEILKEVREHSVSLDMRVDKVRATLRGRPSSEIAAPDFAVVIPGSGPMRRRWPAGPISAAARRDREPGAGLFDRRLRADHCSSHRWVFVRAIVSIFSLDRLLPGIFCPPRRRGAHRRIGRTGQSDRLRLLDLRLDVHRRDDRQDSHGVARGGAWRLAGGFWRSLRRVIGYFISAFVLGLGFPWMIVNKRHQQLG